MQNKAKRGTGAHRSFSVRITGLGAGFLVLLLVTLAGASNENNSFAYLLVFLLLSLFVVSFIRGGLDLLPVRLVHLDAENTFADHRVPVRGALGLCGHPHPASLELSCTTASGQAEGSVMGADGGFQLLLPRQPRGRLRLKSLTVSSHYPAGLLTWSMRLDGLATTALIYPAPIDHLTQLGPEGPCQGSAESGDFGELAPWQAGQSLSGLCWKTYARTGKRMRKHFLASATSRDVSFDWHQLPGLTDEQKRSQLCHWVVESRRNQARCGLRLPGAVIEPGSGAQHYQRCLAALAGELSG